MFAPMHTLALIAALVSTHSWNTTCVMTQADGKSGYTIDSAVFQTIASPTNHLSYTLKVNITRNWYSDSQCSTSSDTSVIEDGTVTIGEALSNSSFSNVPETAFEADWATAGSTQLGAIAIANDKTSIRTATTSFGSMRNTMLSLFRYYPEN